MRFLIIIKATAASEAAMQPRPAPELMAAMAQFHEELARAGVLLDAAGLKPSAAGWRVRYRGDERDIVPGPFPLNADLMSGYTLIDVRDVAEALEWSRRYPNPVGVGHPADIEIRPLYALDDFPPLS